MVSSTVNIEVTARSFLTLAFLVALTRLGRTVLGTTFSCAAGLFAMGVLLLSKEEISEAKVAEVYACATVISVGMLFDLQAAVVAVIDPPKDHLRDDAGRTPLEHRRVLEEQVKASDEKRKARDEARDEALEEVKARNVAAEEVEKKIDRVIEINQNQKTRIARLERQIEELEARAEQAEGEKERMRLDVARLEAELNAAQEALVALARASGSSSSSSRPPRICAPRRRSVPSRASRKWVYAPSPPASCPAEIPLRRSSHSSTSSDLDATTGPAVPLPPPNAPLMPARMQMH